MQFGGGDVLWLLGRIWDEKRDISPRQEERMKRRADLVP